MSERADEALKRLEQDYLRGAIEAEEYARLRGRLTASGASAEYPPQTHVQPTYAQPTHVQPAQVPPPTGYPPGAMPAPYAMEEIDPVTGARLAGWGRRVAASVLDGVIFTLAFIPTLIWAATTIDPVTDEISDDAAGVIVAQAYFLPFLYNSIMLGAWGQTLGKMALGIGVRRAEDAARFGLARALGRTASVFLLSIIFLPVLLSYLWPLWDRRNQTIHDKMADTIVVKS